MKRVECLDGLRGLAALWVLSGHCMILTGFSIPVVRQADLGVDLFIILSGFLMVFQYQIRKNKEDWDKPGTWKEFWVRRFFRISPLYFLCLLAAFWLGEQIYEDRVFVDSFLGRTLQEPERYMDASPLNFIMHVTYVFGLVPSYAFRTALPDWSLGLEMQFYAVFPLLVLFARKAGWIPVAIGAALLAMALVLFTRQLGIIFPMPAFLPLKLHLFLAGMLTAAAIDSRKAPYLILAFLLTAVPIGGEHDLFHLIVRAAIIVGFFALVHWHNIGLISRASALLGSKPFHWLGELSFGAYLIHLLVAQRVAAWTIVQLGAESSALDRFVLTMAVVLPVTYCIAYVTYMAVERPGQLIGRRINAHIAGNKPVR